MPDAEAIRRQVEARLAEVEAILVPLRVEYDQLERVAALLATTTTAPAAPARGPRRARARPAAPHATNGSISTGGGTRAQQAIELIAASPNITAVELAQAMGISRNYLYRVLPRLEKRGVIKKDGNGYHLRAADG